MKKFNLPVYFKQQNLHWNWLIFERLKYSRDCICSLLNVFVFLMPDFVSFYKMVYTQCEILETWNYKLKLKCHHS